MGDETRAPHILVFDSGVGGLSIVAEIQTQLPGCSLSYASDNAAFPYGTKGEEELVARVDKVLHRLIEHTRPDVVVVACNSASTLALPHIRAHFKEPIVGAGSQRRSNHAPRWWAYSPPRAPLPAPTLMT